MVREGYAGARMSALSPAGNSGLEKDVPRACHLGEMRSLRWCRECALVGDVGGHSIFCGNPYRPLGQLSDCGRAVGHWRRSNDVVAPTLCAADREMTKMG